MSLSPQMREMLMPRAAEAVADFARAFHVARRPEPNRWLEAIEKAAPFLDAGPYEGWRPSGLVKIGYCVIATSSAIGAEVRARRFVENTLITARERYRAGFYANPFVKEPVRREA